MRLATRLLAFFLFLPLAVVALSQQADQIDKERENKRLRLQAIYLIRQVATEAPLWNDKEASVLVLTDAADLLWVDNPNQGVKWLRKAWEGTNQVSSDPRNEKLKDFFTGSSQSQLRTTVLSVARKHDPKLAEEFLKQMADKQKNDKTERGAFDDRTLRSEQLLSMAQQVLESNPREAFTLAERSLADGLSYTLQNVLTSLRRKDVQLANRLFDLALARFRSSLPDPSEAQVLAGYLFQPGFTFAANSTGQAVFVLNPTQQASPAVAASEPQRARSFLTAVYELLLTRPISQDSAEGSKMAQSILVLGDRLARPYSTYAPELAPSARGFLNQLRRLSPNDVNRLREAPRTTTTSGSDSTKRLTEQESYERRVAELEGIAEKEINPAFKKVAYVQAALATKPQDYLRAKGIAEKIDDSELRADVVSFIYYRAAMFFVQNRDLEKAMEIAPKISDPLRRAVTKISIAQLLLEAKAVNKEPPLSGLSQQRAFDLLTDIGRDLNKIDPSADVAKVMLGRIAVLARLDHSQAFAALERAVGVINKLENFDCRDSAAPNLGLSVSASSGATVATPRIGFALRSAVDPLIRIDFEQVSSIVGRLEGKERNGIARLEVAKLYLQQQNPAPASPDRK